MNIFQVVYYSCATIYMMSVGWIFHPEDYERYYLARKLVREHPEWVKNNLLQQNSFETNDIAVRR
jgi:hypothetical protein